MIFEESYFVPEESMLLLPRVCHHDQSTTYFFGTRVTRPNHYPAWILIFLFHTQLDLSTTNSILMSVGMPPDGNLGLVRERKFEEKLGAKLA